MQICNSVSQQIHGYKDIDKRSSLVVNFPRYCGYGVLSRSYQTVSIINRQQIIVAETLVRCIYGLTRKKLQEVFQ